MINRQVSRAAAAACVSLCFMAGAASVSAQTLNTTPPAAASSGPNHQVVSANPFLLMYEWFNVEYARAHKPSTSWGASASLLPFDDASYGNVGVFYRYYPQGRALDGFYLGAKGGVHRVAAGSESGLFFGAGFELGYDWRFGREKNFSVGIGAGATRLFGGDMDGVSLVVPTVRLVNVGWSF